MQPTYPRDVTEDEKNNLFDIMDNDTDTDYRVQIILLRSERYTVGEIRRQTNHHDNNIRKWIHRFNNHGIDGIVSRKHNHTAPEKEIVRIVSANPRKLGLKFSTMSLRVLIGYIMEKTIVNSISHAEIRTHGIEWRHSKTVFGNKSGGPEYDLKKAHRGPEE